mgnify:FL=1|tara:strand:+ start:181 stop:1170 length:990 start_codon:yes stop_codon:yes gene_type:complete
MDNILVTGAAGYIGSAFCLEGIERGYKIFGVDNFSNSSVEVVDFLSSSFPDNFNFIKSDLCEKEAFQGEFFSKMKIDYVVHFAGFKSVIESQNNPSLYWDNNVSSTKNLTDFILEKDIKGLLFSSSASVYGDCDIQPVNETTPLKPMSTYGATKKENELILKDLAGSHNLKSISLRYFNPVGSVKNLPKCKPRQDSKNLMDNIVDVCTGQTKNLTIFGDDYSTSDGTAERDYIHIEDLVYAHFEALNYFNHINGFDVFNIGTGKSVSVKQIVKTFKESNEVDFAVEISKRREGDVPICYADANKAKKLLNWETKKSLREMCIDAWSCYK